ncbi:PaaI family thioesterase [Candidatus Thalassolituus haligoni]|jgi:1,4-dihydroxy-2-naphthoyl-CoA hydrolase|uniref:PaaI family thioesterase n=1 Tax=Candidatus Thalassolituus haligoni TaxID=3100113 RepID=UPI003512E4CD|tara:strand:+ start:1397 stop:1867 length:471 start_codon:yes stop_codon:yes gene_type:complete
MSDDKSCWFKEPDIEELNFLAKGTANERVGIEITEAGNDYLKGRMEVNEKTRQPAGVLHGGMSVVLAETLASWGAACAVDPSKYHCVGQEINANHIRAVDSGWVYGVAKPLHIGRKTHVWEVRIRNEGEKLVCVSRVTIAVLETPSQYKPQDNNMA